MMPKVFLYLALALIVAVAAESEPEDIDVTEADLEELGIDEDVPFDPVIEWCWDKCEEWDALERKCEEEKECFPNGEWDEETSLDCVRSCWDIALPCTNACHDAFEACEDNCGEADGEDQECFVPCFNEDFEQNTPELPE